MIEILLSTYNGQRFLKEQLDSIIKQTYQDWRLLIRDDASTDSTLEIINSYSENHPNKIILIEDKEKNNLGACQSFNNLIKQAKASYLMFCDQDDVWLPNKIEVMIRKMNEIEKKSEGNIPLLLHSDLKVTDSDLNVISNSFIKHNKLDIRIKEVCPLSMRNNVTASTIMCNRALYQKATPIPSAAIMHDWWFTLITSLFGEIHFISKPLILYRQHKDNCIGATIWYKKIMIYLNIKRYRTNLLKISHQIDALHTIFSNDISNIEDKKYILEFSNFSNISFLNKKIFIWKHLRGQQPLQKTLFMLILA